VLLVRFWQARVGYRQCMSAAGRRKGEISSVLLQYMHQTHAVLSPTHALTNLQTLPLHFAGLTAGFHDEASAPQLP